MSVPSWIQDAVFYQIFPDRFANGDPANDPPNVQAWGAPPTLTGFQGGDLRGIIDRLDYLLDLGVNALYLNPIFMASSNHRYNTYDYFKVDPKLGSLEDFQTLVCTVHKKGMRIILDGVFNHCGRGFFAFNDLAENQEQSPYRDWFHVRRFPIQPYGPGDAETYFGWWKLKSLPKFNTDSPKVRAYLMDVVRYWTRQGIDGWRLDVPNEIDDDNFWATFRETVRTVNPDAYLVGEIWEVEPRWVGPTHFDGLMNYPLRKSLLELLGQDPIPVSEFAQSVTRLLQAYPHENVLTQYLPLGSHDTPRVRTLLEGDDQRLRLMLFIQFTFPGAPAVYYGDEIGVDGGEDPDNRRAFPWDENAWDHELRRYVQQLIALRKAQAPLRDGWLELVSVEDDARTLVYRRGEGESAIIVAANASATAQRVEIDARSAGWHSRPAVRDLLKGVDLPLVGGRLSLPLAPWEGVAISPAADQPHSS